LPVQITEKRVNYDAMDLVVYLSPEQKGTENQNWCKRSPGQEQPLCQLQSGMFFLETQRTFESYETAKIWS